ncbi:MAG: IPT/TIG domain-containing protein [Bryobacteraceae bacterium]
MTFPSFRNFVVTFASAAVLCQAQQAFTINTVVGIGTAGFSGDAAAANLAQVNFPTAITRSASGTLYIADTFNIRIRTVQTDGIIRTVAGTGTRGFSADGTAAATALISSPYGVAVDAAGNIYFSDSLNMMIRKVSTTGTVTRIAGTGVQGFGGDGGNAVDALLNLPTGLAVDSAGNIYVADTQNHRIRKITTDGKISTVFGTGQPSYDGDGKPGDQAPIYYPESVALDSAGNLYVADTFNHRIRKLTAGIASTVAGNGTAAFKGDGGQAASASLNYPRGVFVDASGNVLIADSLNNRIRMVTENKVIRTIAGAGFFGDAGDGGLASLALLRYPRAVISDGSGGYLVLDTDNQRIRQLTPIPQSPAINQNGVVSSSAFGGFSSAARGSWMEIYGSNLAQGKREWASSDFVEGKAPTSLAGTSVTIGGQPAFVSYVSPGQVNVQVPDTLTAGVHEVVVKSAIGASTAYKVTVNDVEPGLFAPSSLQAGGKQYAGVILADGSVASPSGASIRAGDTVTLYGIGFGSVAPNLAAGEIVRNANSVVMPLQIYFGDTAATVTYAGLAPGTLGLYQINVVVPQVSGNAIPLTFKLNGASGTQALYTSVSK